MQKPLVGTEAGAGAWASDFFGGLNALPPEAIAVLTQVLEAMATQPGFQQARRAMVHELGLAAGSRVLDGGCGTGAALADLAEVVGTQGQIVGVDPTTAFIARARQRAAEAGIPNAVYQTGDVRSLPFSDGTFDAALCDKVLIHVGPPGAVLGELVRVTKPGGRVGALEWQPHFFLSTTRPQLESRFNGVFRQAMHNLCAAANLPRYFREAGLTDIRTHTDLISTDDLDDHPFWRVFVVDQLPAFVQAGLLEAEEGRELAADLEQLGAHGEFRAAFVVVHAVGTRPGVRVDERVPGSG